MRMELIQPFINAADAVFAESLQAPTKIGDLTMDENTYRRKGIAALIIIKGDIEGRVILDLALGSGRTSDSDAADCMPRCPGTACRAAQVSRHYAWQPASPDSAPTGLPTNACW